MQNNGLNFTGGRPILPLMKTGFFLSQQQTYVVATTTSTREGSDVFVF